MSVDAVLEEVNRRVADKIVPRLLDRAVNNHASREWRECQCLYCDLKRRATHDVGFILTHSAVHYTEYATDPRYLKFAERVESFSARRRFMLKLYYRDRLAKEKRK